MTDPNEYSTFVSQILRPTNVDSFRHEHHDLTVIVHTDQTKQTTLFFDDLFPFYTVSDLMMKIFIQMKEQIEFHPTNQCLLQSVANDNLSQGFFHFQFAQTDAKYEPIYLINPFERVQGEPDPNFVFRSGLSTNVKSIPREHCLLSTVLFHQPKDKYELHLFSFVHLYDSIKDLLPLSKKNWEGKIRPYFPRKFTETIALTKEELKFTKDSVRRFQEKDDLVKRMDHLLSTKELLKNATESEPLSQMKIKNLRIGWKAPVYNTNEYELFTLESIFFDTQVSKYIPYMRLYGAKGAPISKVYVEGPANIPGMDDPEVLLQWNKQKTILPTEDLLMMKCLVRPADAANPPLYGTLFLFQSGHAKFILQPNEGTNSLSREFDLLDLDHVLQFLNSEVARLQPKQNIDQPPISFLQPFNAYLEETYSVFALQTQKNERPLTPASLIKVLPYFRPFFQMTTSPIAEQNPLLFLRYKGVDNFQTPSRDFQFLKRFVEVRTNKGEEFMFPELVELYKEEFNVPEDVAQERVADFGIKMTTVQKVVPDPTELEYVQAENPGLDIAIFGKHPFYFFHTYRITSLEALVLIKTLLSLLISVEPSDFGKAETKELEEEEEEEKQAANQQAQIEIKEAKSSKVKDVAVEEETEFLGFGMQAFGTGSDEEENQVVQKEASQTEEIATPITEDTLQKETVAKYFLERLKMYDRGLFVWSRSDDTKKSYARSCPANDMKQPIVMSEGEYRNMLDIYKEDIDNKDVMFINYPIPDGTTAPVPNDSKTEVVTTLRYGTKIAKGEANIYLCSELWCRLDKIVVLKKDFINTVDRNNKPKPKDTCPFCRNGLISETEKKSKTAKGTVIQRKVVRDKRHTYVGFSKSKIHPSHFGLPCCFVVQPNDIHEGDEEFLIKKKTFYKQPLQVIEEVTENLKKEREDEVQQARINMVMPQQQEQEESLVEESKEFVCGLKIQDMRKPYIVGAEKLPLEIRKQEPQVGILPGAVDKYFAQTSVPNLVRQDGTVWKIVLDNKTQRANASGFFRIAVDNSKANHANSFLAAIAPYYSRNSANQMKEYIRDVIVPKRFLALNYGNFLFDFYNTSSLTPTDAQVQKWVKDHFQPEVEPGLQMESFTRLFKAWNNYSYILQSKYIRKEYRQFAHVFSQNGLFTRGERTNGLLFIVLEIDNKEVTVRCPPYGVSQHMMDTCDIAFINYHPKYQIWEPIFYTYNKASEGKHEFMFSFAKENQASWPPIVQQRVQEYYEMCKSSGLGVYTEVPGIHSSTLIPLTQAFSIPNVRIRGIMRDLNNHISNIIFYSDSNKYITVPVVDDGILHDDVFTIFDWDEIYRQLAPADVVRDFYENTLSQITSLNPSWKQMYEIVRLKRIENKDPDSMLFSFPEVYTFELAGGMYIPVQKPSKAQIAVEDIGFGMDLPWMINRKTVYSELEPSKEEMLNEDEFEEIYQHLRFTFANWLAFQPVEFTEKLLRLVQSSYIPLFEKRTRLETVLGPEITSWLEPTQEYNMRKPSIKRVDCRVKAKDECTDRCIWKESEGKGQCKLHVPQTKMLGNVPVDVVTLMKRKVIEELIRFPRKRDELLHQRVSKYQVLHDAFLSGNEYIIPENVPAWTEFLRMDWQMKKEEHPQHLEEMIAVESVPEKAKPIKKKRKGITQIQMEPEPTELKQMQPTILKQMEAKSSKEVVMTTMSPIKPIPLEVAPLFKGKKLYFHPVGSVLEGLCEAGLNLFEFVERFEVDETIPLLQNLDQAEYVAQELQRSIYQLSIEEGLKTMKDVVIVQGTYPNSSEAPFLMILQTPSGQLGMISSDPAKIVELEKSNFPKPLIAKAVFKNVRTTFIGDEKNPFSAFVEQQKPTIVETQKPMIVEQQKQTVVETQKPIVGQPKQSSSFVFPSDKEMSDLQNKKFAQACPFTKADLEAIHNAIAFPILQNKPVPKEPYAFFMCGAAGSGKSSLTKSITAEKGVQDYILADPDIALSVIPWDAEKKGKCRTVCTALLADLLVPKYLESKHHIVLDFTCRDSRMLQMMLKKAKKEKYTTVLVEVYVSEETAQRRVKERQAKTGRVVDEKTVSYIYGQFKDLAKDYIEEIVYPFDEVYLYNNNEDNVAPMLLFKKDSETTKPCLVEDGEFYFDYQTECGN
jgi:predicted ABC-type ATPase